MIRLHHVPHSRSFRTMWLMTEMGLEFEVEEYLITDGSLNKIAGMSPAARAPALEIDGMTMFESGAMAQYLVETRDQFGPGEGERPRFLQLVHFAETQASLIEQLNLNHIFLLDPSQASPVVIKVNTARLKKTLAGLEALLGARDYLLESGFSAADTMLGFNLSAAPRYVHLDPFPALQAYKARIEARPAYQKAVSREGAPLYTKDFYPVPE